ncbi:xanthine dehydrogenase family protein molybdopterin-binding subunit [Flammeovirga aprica]|uniref:Xanthine dehydrogenase family protein molybdopterin-binding subunit n=1 Tax=Flammeovirga aprica JL-4 TaxID=694437 RepID=A0A7X9RTW1_9BACT|nr:molybdopterin cofactor-binding domain-containing protein [Flammeovirga aprica]NME68104.1 xanthine dehydrogenase family protein molybdopterin-binding subunit [Flammeovirga aprica JL-4]
MSNTHSRRNFLKLSLLAGGGLLIGVGGLSNCSMPTSTDDLDFQRFNAYIEMSPNGIVKIYSPNPEIGQGIKTAMPMIVAEELDVPWEKVQVAQAPLSNDFNRQVAGGSQSIRQNFPALRTAGATVKLMLLTAAAKNWDVEVETLEASQGVISSKSGKKIKYEELIHDAVKLPVPENAPLKKVEEFTLIGTAVNNVDIDPIITGKPLFGVDYKEKGMKYAAVARPPFGASLKSVDDTEAKGVKGVEQVIQFNHKVAVIASSTWAAFKGKSKLKIEWDNLQDDENTDLFDQKMHETLRKGNLEEKITHGNFAEAKTKADKVIEKTYEAPFLPHNTMEPMNFFADVTPQKIRLIGPTQVPKASANVVAKLLDRNVEDITVEMTRMGGGFGRRLSTDYAEDAAMVSHLAKAPIKLMYTREDDMAVGQYRPKVKYKITAAVKNNELIGYQLQEVIVNNKGMNKGIAKFFPFGTVDHYSATSSNIPADVTTLWWRAPITNFLGFATESFMDELAITLQKDPIALRMELLEKAKGQKVPYSPERMQKTIQLVKEKSNWGNAPSGVYQGFACYYSHNSYVAEVCDLEMIDGKPVAKRFYAGVDCGIVINTSGAKSQIEGAILDGIGHAMYGNLELKDGIAQSKNFDQYKLIRMMDTPTIETYFVDSNEAPTGLGEPGMPPAGAAYANAYVKATGKRMLQQPFFG